MKARAYLSGALFAASLSCVTAAVAGAQLRVLPRVAQPGSTESYVLQVANTHRQAITKVEIRFPRSVRVISVGERPDWPAQIVYSGDRLSAAVWSGALAPARYTEFGFLAVNPMNAVTLLWPVIVTYADGERVAWWPSSIGTKAPATVIVASARVNGSIAIAFAVCVIAFLLAIVALILALRGGPARSGLPPVD